MYGKILSVQIELHKNKKRKCESGHSLLYVIQSSFSEIPVGVHRTTLLILIISTSRNKMPVLHLIVPCQCLWPSLFRIMQHWDDFRKWLWKHFYSDLWAQETFHHSSRLGILKCQYVFIFVGSKHSNSWLTECISQMFQRLDEVTKYPKDDLSSFIGIFWAYEN